MEESHRELQMLSAAPSSSGFKSSHQPSLDLQLSISMSKPPASVMRKMRKQQYSKSKEAVEALRWQAAEQIRLAAMEKAYAERVRELTRREMELAHSDFTRARAMWERAREELQRADRTSASAAAAASTCMEITCHSCSHKFRP